MDCHQGSGFPVANVVGFQSGNSGNGVNENRVIGPIGKADWNAEDGICNEETSVQTNLKSNFNGRQFQLEVESEPPNKRAKNNILGDSTSIDHRKATEKVLYKTRLCYQFRAGSCPFIENCDFAHSKEELRELPHNWQEIVSAHKEEEMESSEQPRELFQRPIMGLNEEIRGSNQRLQCKGFLTRFGCQFGENCIFIHNEHYEERKSAAIYLHPGPGGGCESNGSKRTLNASNWKSRICNKWESTGFCAYGRNCIFAHGYAVLQHYARRLVTGEAIGFSAFSANQVAAPPIASLSAAGGPASLVPYSYHFGAPPRRLPAEIPKTGEIPIKRWKGPDKISKIYGDWIDDL